MVYNENMSFNLNLDMDSLEKYAIASRDFKIGEEILEENVVLFGPISEPKFPICLGCGIHVDCSITCYDCGWPICKSTCDKLIFHKINECEIFKKCRNMSFQRLTSKRNVFHQYDCILPLRMLLLIERSPEKWKYIQKLNSFLDIRRDDASWQSEQLYVVKYIRQKCKLKKFDEKLIHMVCGIVNINSFHVSNNKNNIRCIYKDSHNFSHNCVPNTTFVILPSHNFRIYFRASINISKGTKLTYSKTKVILPTLLRRQDLIRNSYLSCFCDRCSDPTELRSHFSSLKCPKCKIGFLMSTDPLDFEADWRCITCKLRKRFSHLKKLYNEVEKELNKIKIEMNLEKCERLLQKYEPVFHFNHSFIVYLKYYSLLISLDGDTFQISKNDNINLKIIKLYEILSVFDIISPGYTKLRGTIFYLLYKAYIVKAKQCNKTNQHEKELYLRYMSTALKFLDMTEKMIIGKCFSDVMES